MHGSVAFSFSDRIQSTIADGPQYRYIGLLADEALPGSRCPSFGPKRIAKQTGVSRQVPEISDGSVINDDDKLLESSFAMSSAGIPIDRRRRS
jgi:hypothetical protein